MAMFEIYKPQPDGRLVLSEDFKLPQTLNREYSVELAANNSNGYTVTAAFDPRATSGSSIKAYGNYFSNNGMTPLVQNLANPMHWFNFTTNVPFSPFPLLYYPSFKPPVQSSCLAGGAGTLKIRVTDLDANGLYSDKYLAIYKNGSLRWSLDKLLKSPRIIGRLVIPASSRNSLTSKGFVSLPAGIDLSRVYILPNTSVQMAEFSDAPAGMTVSGISYCITPAGVHGRYFSKGGNYTMLLQDAVALIAYI